MLQSLLRFTTKPLLSYEDAEKELTEIIDLFSKYQLYLAETEKSEFRNEHDRRVFCVEFFLFIDNNICQTSPRNLLV